MRVARGVLGPQPDLLEQRARRARAGRGRAAMPRTSSGSPTAVADGHARIERGDRVLEHHLHRARAASRSVARSAPAISMPVDAHAAATSARCKPDHGVRDGGFAAAGFADEAERLAGRDGEARRRRRRGPAGRAAPGNAPRDRRRRARRSLIATRSACQQADEMAAADRAQRRRLGARSARRRSGQRSAKRQPAGNSAGAGTRPSMTASADFGASVEPRDRGEQQRGVGVARRGEHRVGRRRSRRCGRRTSPRPGRRCRRPRPCRA